VLAERDLTQSDTEVYSNLTAKEKDELIGEIENFQDGDLLTPITITYETLAANDDSGLFIGEPRQKDLADKILDLLAANSQKLEKLESELSQLKIEGVVSNSEIEVSESDRKILEQLPNKMEFYFYSGSSSLTSAALLQLNELVEILARSEKIRVVITGFTDKTGNAQANLALSKKRAQTVKKFMTESGMAEDRFIINYYGESKSDSFGNQDRRVEIKFFID